MSRLQNPLDILQSYWGYDSFRTPQEEIIGSVLDGKDTLALLPTGGGKSICFQIPGLILDGLCLVVSPLIALMRDQVDQLEKRGIKAKALFSGMSHREIDIALDNCIYGNVKFLYVSPERLKSQLFLARAQKMKFSLIAIDEAHCISQWGYDFRPPYLEIDAFIQAFSIPRKIALTATATKEVKEDIVAKLQFYEPQVFTKSFARSNLSYSVFNLERKEDKLQEIIKNVPGSSVVYVRSRKRTQEIAGFLRAAGFSADFYHAGLHSQERERRQTLWIENKVRVMVATNAFGMGIDKPDVRTVVHMDLPDTLEAYYQEAGRAGRDSKKSYAIMLYHSVDETNLFNRIERSYVTLEQIKKVYQALANYYKLAVGSRVDGSFDFEMDTFCERFNLSSLEVHSVLKKLEEEGLLLLSESFYHSSQLLFLVSKEELYRFQVSHSSLEKVTKVLLRLYGGEVFTEYTKIKENELAKLLKVTPGQVITWLEMLDSYEIINYLRKSNQDQLSFVGGRLDTNNLPLDQKEIDRRKELALTKANAVINYISSRSQCRTRMLQAYFDEVSEDNCGVCDYCVDRRKSSTSKVDPKLVFDLIKNESIRDIETITLKTNSSRHDVTEALRLLISDGLIQLVDERIELT